MEKPNRWKLEIFDSLESENRAEHRRRAKMTPQQRMAELAALQIRQWGEGWWKRPMDRVCWIEEPDWMKG